MDAIIAYIDESGDPNLSTFAVVVHKSKTFQPNIVLDAAWTVLLQRLQRTSTASGDCPIIIVHDEGENAKIRKIARLPRKRLAADSMDASVEFSVPFTTLIEDPIPKASHESYFLQLADLVAYAAFRRIYPPPNSVSNVIHKNMWDQLGRSIFAPANQNKARATLGIVEVWK